MNSAMEQTLLLNATFEPLKVVHWQKAVTLWCQGKVEIIATHDREVRMVNMGMVSGILPVVGVPLPFISYGGTAMVTLGLGLGLLMSIAKSRRLIQC
jgi:hypothetical protein